MYIMCRYQPLSFSSEAKKSGKRLLCSGRFLSRFSTYTRTYISNSYRSTPSDTEKFSFRFFPKKDENEVRSVKWVEINVSLPRFLHTYIHIPHVLLYIRFILQKEKRLRVGKCSCEHVKGKASCEITIKSHVKSRSEGRQHIKSHNHFTRTYST